MHMSVALNEPIELLNITPVNPLISKCQIKVCYVGDDPNRNRSVITKEVARELANTIPGCPIVGYYNEATADFEEHNRIIDISNGKFEIKDTTRPYGFVSMDAKVWFQKFLDDNKDEHEYLMTEGYIWTGQYPESQRIITKGNNQSMELDEDSLDATWTKDINGNPQFFIINEAIMSKLCILGEDVEPCFEGSQITKVQFSFEDGFKEQLFSMIKEMKEILTNEGGTPVFTTYAVEIGDSLWSALYDYMRATYPDPDDEWCSLYRVEGIYEENTQKFVILQNRKDFKFYRLNFSITDAEGLQVDDTLVEVTKTYVPAAEPQFPAEKVEEYIAQYKAEHEVKEEDDKPEEPAPAETPVEEPAPVFAAETGPVAEEPAPVVEEPVPAEPPVDYKAMYEESQGQIAELQTKVSEQAAEIERLTADNTNLNNFKLTVEREKKQGLIDSFYYLSDEQKKDCVDNIDTYSYDDIEAKLAVVCLRNKVSFNFEEEAKEEAPVAFNLESAPDTDAGIPDWVKRVQEVAKEKNLD